MRLHRLATVLLLLMVIPGSAAAKTGYPFFFAEDYPVSSSAVAIAAGDFDGDGLQDIVVANGDGQVQIFLAITGGGFKPWGKYPAAQYANAVAVADVNGDHKLDIIVAGGPAAGGEVDVLLGNGDSTFQTAVPYGLLGKGISLAVGDFNGDGKPDLAVGFGGFSQSGIAIFLNNGNGIFGQPMTYASGTAPSSLAVGDFNRDSRLDLLFVDAPGVDLILGNGDGTFGEPTSVNVSIFVYSLTAGDFNGDGSLDFVAAGVYEGGYDYGNIEVVLGNGDGTFRAGVRYPSGGWASRWQTTATTLASSMDEVMARLSQP